jgi:glucosamine-6-phosphate deaminase
VEIILQTDVREASHLAARMIGRVIREKPRPVLGLATGRSMIQVYAELVRLHREEGLDFSRAVTFNLDEYVGLTPGHAGSFHEFMNRHLFAHVNIPAGNIHIPDGMAADIPAHCLAYEKAIRDAGGIDLQLMGIGSDGHIGFNEPTSSLGSRTRIKTLTEETRLDNAGTFRGADRVPHHCITMGIGTIMESRACLLLAFGAKKAAAVAAACEGPITAMVPASILQLHPRAIIIVDREAASALKKSAYYEWVYRHKPNWQKD